jgi:hypothetical protein
MSEFCKKCGQAFVQVSVDKDGNAMMEDGCECWLEDAYAESKRQEDHYSDEDLPSEPPDFEDEDFDYFDEYYDTPSEVNQNLDFHKVGLEEISASQFAQLRSKYEVYGLNKCVGQENTPPSNQILILLDRGQPIDKSYMLWLKQEMCFQFAGFVNYQNYFNRKPQNGYDLAKACSFYKRAGLSAVGIRITEDFPVFSNGEMCAILTARGAAFRYLGRNTFALDCAIKALKYNFFDYRTHSLLGAIYHNNNKFIGKIHFRIADLLSSTNNKQNDMVSSLEKLEHQFRKVYDVSISNWEKALCSWAQQYIPNI